MSTLETVEDYISDVRTLLQDAVSPYRYDDTSLLVAFNSILLEMRRVRPDLFVYKHHDQVPSFSSVAPTQVHIEAPFRLALVYGTTAHALARDQEDVQDARANMFLTTFYQMLTGASPQQAAAPPPSIRQGKTT